MWTGIGIITAAAVIGIKEGVPLWKKRKKKDFAVVSALIALGTAACLAQAADVSLPNPLDWINAFLKPYIRTVYFFLE